MPITKCDYCGNDFTPDKRGRCTFCGAPAVVKLGNVMNVRASHSYFESEEERRHYGMVLMSLDRDYHRAMKEAERANTKYKITLLVLAVVLVVFVLLQSIGVVALW